LAVELERILSSLGQSASVDDLTDLIYKIDRKNSGVLEFNNFMACVIPYLRDKYKKAPALSLGRLKISFDKMDTNGDGNLNPYEFRHAVNNGSSHFSTGLILIIVIIFIIIFIL
jgi:Ca2+-binding EF-hand superfamily protein